MRKAFRRYSIAFLCALFLFHYPAYAADDASPESSVITAIENADTLANLPALEIIQNLDGEKDELFEYIFNLRKVNAEVLHPDGQTETITLNVDWQSTHYGLSTINTTVLGTYTEIGTIVLPDDSYIFGEGVLTSLTLPVNVVVPDEPFIITEFDYCSDVAGVYAILPGTDLEEIISDQAEYWTCYDNDYNEYLAPVTWDTSQVDTNTVGLYSLIGRPGLPLHCQFDEKLELPTQTVIISVQAEGKPDINCMEAGRGSIAFPWVGPAGSLDNVSVWLAEGDGGYEQILMYEGAYWDESLLMLNTRILTRGETYRLQVDYEGGQTGILTFTYGSSFIIESYNSGDRDGGDTDGNPSRDESQTDESESFTEETEPEQSESSAKETESELPESSTKETESELPESSTKETESELPESSTKETEPALPESSTKETEPAKSEPPVKESKTSESQPLTPESETNEAKPLSEEFEANTEKESAVSSAEAPETTENNTKHGISPLIYIMIFILTTCVVILFFLWYHKKRRE